MTAREGPAGGAVAGGAVVGDAAARPTAASVPSVLTTPSTAPSAPPHWDVATLCGPSGEAILVHKGEHYRLRVTARGRLILTK